MWVSGGVNLKTENQNDLKKRWNSHLRRRPVGGEAPPSFMDGIWSIRGFTFPGTNDARPHPKWWWWKVRDMGAGKSLGWWNFNPIWPEMLGFWWVPHVRRFGCHMWVWEIWMFLVNWQGKTGCYVDLTLPETNISPENRPLEKEIPIDIGNHQFQGLC